MSWFWRFVEANPDELWDYVWSGGIPDAPWVTMEHPGKLWDWIGLSRNPNITWSIVKDNPDKPWDWDGLSSNPTLRGR